MTLFEKIKSGLIKPFGENLHLLLSLWVLASFADFVEWVVKGDVIFASYMAIHGLVVGYFVVLIIGLFNNKGKVPAFILGVLNLLIDSACYISTRHGFDSTTVALFMGTNMDEVNGFFELYFNWKIILLVVSGTLISIIPLVIKKYRKFCVASKWSICFFSIFIALFFTTIIRKSHNYPGVFLCKPVLFFQYQSPVDLTQYRKTLTTERTAPQPQNIVFILGESIAKSHCSLYGYNKMTQPKLGEMKENGDLFVYDNVKSSAQLTVESVILMLTSSSWDDINDGTWMEQNYIFDLMRSADYHSYWVTNQELKGLWDNVVGKFAELADYVCPTTDYSSAQMHYDGELVNVLNEIRQSSSTGQKSFYIVHQIGAHEPFSLRCPSEFASFVPDDYAAENTEEFSLNKRTKSEWAAADRKEKLKILAEYDNSVLYNDYVVSEIMHSFDDGEAVIVYCSDHGMDIFETDPHYAGHALAGSQESRAVSSDIPFMIYVTDKYRENFPEMVELMEQSQSTEFETGDMLYSFMDLASIVEVGKDSLMVKSLFRR